MKSLFVLGVSLLAQLAFAAACNPSDKEACCDFSETRGSSRITRISTYDKSACTINVNPGNENKSYRRFGFGSDGTVSIFMQPGGDQHRGSAMEMKVFFPFDENPTLESSRSGRFEVDTGSGQVWTFDAATATPVSIDDCEVRISSNFTTSNSGVDITSCSKHLFIETPVDPAGEYLARQHQPITIHDPHGHTCELTTNDLYEYPERGRSNTKDGSGHYYNYRLRFDNNAALGRQLHAKCPGLDVSLLTAHRKPLELNLDDLKDTSSEPTAPAGGADDAGETDAN